MGMELESTAAGSGAVFIEQSGGTFTLTNGSTIQGAGVIGNGGLTVVNGAGGIIDANVTGGGLTLKPGGGVSNTGGALQTTNGRLFALCKSTIKNKDATVTDASTSSAITH